MTNDRVQRPKAKLFLAAYTLFITVKILRLLVGGVKTKDAAIPYYSPLGAMLRSISFSSFVLLWGISLVFIMSMYKKKFVYSRSVKVLAAGVGAWLLWGFVISFSGLTMFPSSGDYYELARYTAFISTLVMASRVVISYDIFREVVGITCFVLGTILLGGYVTHFNGLEFLGSLGGIFQASDRYRVAFGFNHVNTTGRMCMHYFMFMALYKVLLQEKQSALFYARGGGRKSFRSDTLYSYLLMLSPIILIMLLSTASRTSIAGVILFWMVYFALTQYQKFGGYAKPLLFSGIVLLTALSFLVFDWYELFEYFYASRGINFTSTLPILAERNFWLTGMGFTLWDTLNRVRTTTLLDNFYLATLLQSGLVGFFLLIGTVARFTYLYFREAMRMNKQDRIIGGVLIAMLFYGMLEDYMFGQGPFDFVNWLLAVTAMNERSRRTEIYTSTSLVS